MDITKCQQMIVVDTSIFLAVALDEPEKQSILRLTKGAAIAAPEVMPFEVGNALSAMAKRGRLTPDEAREAQRICKSIPVRLRPVDIERALDIALRFNSYAYDAYFLECARTLACPLLTLDRPLVRNAAQLGVEVLEASS